MLKADGFNDIENKKGELKRSEYKKSRKCEWDHEFLVEAKREYFTWAGEFASWFAFSNQFDKTIWSLHAEGWTTREIESLVHKDHTTVFRRLSVMREEFFRLTSWESYLEEFDYEP